VVGAAEIVVVHAGIAELTGQQQAVRRRWVTALKKPAKTPAPR
jgi:hypothetical protein